MIRSLFVFVCKPPWVHRVLFELIASLEPAVRSAVTSVAFDGTSATALLVDPRDGTPLTAPKLYNEPQGQYVVAAAKVRAYNCRLDLTVGSNSVSQCSMYSDLIRECVLYPYASGNYSTRD